MAATKITITKADFLSGTPGDRCGCPIAIALTRLSYIRCAHVFPAHAYLELVDGRSRTIALSRPAQKLVAKFDKIIFPERMRVDPRSRFDDVALELDATEVADVDLFSSASFNSTGHDEGSHARDSHNASISDPQRLKVAEELPLFG